MRLLSGLVIGGVLALSLGCDSKFQESSPEGVSGVGLTFEERITDKKNLDKRIEQLIAASGKLKNILALFKRVTKSDGAQVYTPVDFLIDMNQELQDKIPSVEQEHLVRRGKFELPITNVPQNCRMIETRLQTEGIHEQTDDFLQVAPLGEKATFFLRTCASKRKFIPVITATWIGNEMRIQFNEDNFRQIYSDLAIKGILTVELANSATCSFDSDPKTLVESISCENLSLNLSKTEWALFSNLIFSNAGNTRLEAHAEIFGENQDTAEITKKATLSVSIPKRGTPTIQLQKVGENDSSSLDTNDDILTSDDGGLEDIELE